jgi:hypothetical protein
VRLAFGALFIKQRPGLTDEETMGQIRENAYMQFFLGFAGYSSKAPFDPSMIVHSRQRFLEEDLMRINELIVERGKAMKSKVQMIQLLVLATRCPSMPRAPQSTSPIRLI